MALADDVRATMADPDVKARHPEGITAVDLLDEIRATGRGEYPLITWLDVHDELKTIYGEPLSHGR